MFYNHSLNRMSGCYVTNKASVNQKATGHWSSVSCERRGEAAVWSRRNSDRCMPAAHPLLWQDHQFHRHLSDTSFLPTDAPLSRTDLPSHTINFSREESLGRTEKTFGTALDLNKQLLRLSRALSS